MWQRARSLARLQQQRDALETELAEHAQRLASRCGPEELVAALMPQARRLVEVRSKILRATPARVLMERAHTLEHELRRSTARDERTQRLLRDELRDLRLYLDTPRRRPLTLRVLLILLASVAAALLLPDLVVDLLSGA
ncbi:MULTISPECIES: hypothetical protein [unclassified Stenotrophomonas]|uniref:hypothetical protein n=1 Tax=unclassified Stenotrophomonas TaxID=196198 RepID=UPI000D17C6E9|nr:MULTISPECIES: hypothetical protein [unclassified Stenotrophomonas]PTA71334.1 hypothetical protein C9412_12455 [Stenotrophomonas sp. Nf1]PTA79745.1 hypothetical protein C9416_11695 [Stenotrophomonas sp. Nf4]